MAFGRGKSTTDQLILLTQEIEDSFAAKRKAGAVFVDLTAFYNIIWHRSLTCMLLRLLPESRMMSLIMELVCNRSFTLTTGTGKQSSLRRLKIGVLQRSILASLFFNIYTYDFPVPVCTKFADDLAILHCASNWKALVGLLLRTWQSYPPICTNGSSSSEQQRMFRQPSIFTTRRHNVILTSFSIA